MRVIYTTQKNGVHMIFKENVLTQAKLHKALQPQDMIKLCYQAAFGAEHLMQDIDKAKQYLYNEFASIDTDNTCNNLLYEEISPSMCRVNLSVWKKENLPINALFDIFCKSIQQDENGAEKFLKYVQEVKTLAQNGAFNFSYMDFDEYYNSYLHGGIRAVHHSEKYRTYEKPAYRIVQTNLLLLYLDSVNTN